MTSQSAEGREFHDFEMLDARIASALKRIISDQYFRRRIDVEEQHAQKIRQNSTRKADCLYDLHLRAFRATGMKAALDPSDLFNVSLQGDDILESRYKMGLSSAICK